MSFTDIADAAGRAIEAMTDRMNPDLEKCSKCGDAVKVMAFRGTKLCSELCRKVTAGEMTEEAWTEAMLHGGRVSAAQ